MARAFLCKCCGLPAAQEAQCVTCEAPACAHDEVIEPTLHGEPLAVTVQALLCVMRGATDAGQGLVSSWRVGGSRALSAASFDGLAQITGASFGPAGNPVANANKAAAAWLLEGKNDHAPAR